MKLRVIVATALGLALAAGGFALAQQERAITRAGRTPVPVPPKGKGDSCVAPTEWMRRNHMTALLHQRDRTVHEGVRTKQFSLTGCIECHAVPGDGGRPVSAADPKHFCRTCHDYAAVKVDCFECHASRPPNPKSASLPAGRDDLAALVRYLGRGEP
jgi:hypothetical protein